MELCSGLILLFLELHNGLVGRYRSKLGLFSFFRLVICFILKRTTTLIVLIVVGFLILLILEKKHRKRIESAIDKIIIGHCQARDLLYNRYKKK
jgi:hypothetical protein